MLSHGSSLLQMSMLLQMDIFLILLLYSYVFFSLLNHCIFFIKLNYRHLQGMPCPHGLLHPNAVSAKRLCQKIKIILFALFLKLTHIPENTEQSDQEKKKKEKEERNIRGHVNLSVKVSQVFCGVVLGLKRLLKACQI